MSSIRVESRSWAKEYFPVDLAMNMNKLSDMAKNIALPDLLSIHCERVQVYKKRVRQQLDRMSNKRQLKNTNNNKKNFFSTVVRINTQSKCVPALSSNCSDSSALLPPHL